MKTIITLLAALICVSGWAQNDYSYLRFDPCGDQLKASYKSYIDQQLDSIIHYKYDPATGDFSVWEREHFEYNHHGFVSSHTTFSYDPYAYRPYIRDEFSYDENRLIKGKTIVKRDSDPAPWAESRFDYVYDASYNLIMREYFQKTSPVPNTPWERSNKDVYIYTANNIMDSSIMYTWEHSTQEYFIFAVVDYEYNGQQQLTKQTRFSPQAGGVYNPGYRYRYVYNNDGKLTEEFEETNYTNPPSFHPRHIRNFYYNANQQLISYKLHSIYTPQTSILEEYTYDNNGDMASLNISKFNTDSSQYELSSESSYIRSTTKLNDYIALKDDIRTFKPYYRYRGSSIQSNYQLDTVRIVDAQTQELDIVKVYYYAPFSPVNIAQSENVNAKVYPNPALDRVYIDAEGLLQGSMLSLYDVNGRVVRCEQLDDKQSVSLMGLPSGLYIYRIQVEGKVLSGKLIKH